jgi:hypothetical protein
MGATRALIGIRSFFPAFAKLVTRQGVKYPNDRRAGVAIFLGMRTLISEDQVA